MEKRTRIILFSIAGVLVIIALVWQAVLNNTGEQARLCNLINAFGYDVIAEDLYVTDVGESTTNIRSILPESDLEQAVAVSKQARFASDIDRMGKVVLVMAPLLNGDVITIYLVDEQPEMGFVQIPNSTEVYALGQER